MAVSGNGQPNPRFQPYVPQPWPDSGESPSTAWGEPGPADYRDLGREGQPEEDLWDFDPNIKLPNDAYRGVRRASDARPRRRVVVVVVVVLVVLAVVGLVIAMKFGADPTNRADADVPAFVPSGVGTGQPSPPQASATGTPAATSSGAVPAFAPLTFEAEAGPPTVKRRGGDVETLAGASGGRVVRFVGGSGEIEIRGVAFTDAGTYRISIYYASQAAGTAVVSLPNAAPLTVSFAAGSACCAAAAVDVALPSGPRTITISQVANGVAIDKIVITRSRP